MNTTDVLDQLWRLFESYTRSPAPLQARPQVLADAHGLILQLSRRVEQLERDLDQRDAQVLDLVAYEAEARQLRIDIAAMAESHSRQLDRQEAAHRRALDAERKRGGGRTALTSATRRAFVARQVADDEFRAAVTRTAATARRKRARSRQPWRTDPELLLNVLDQLDDATRNYQARHGLPEGIPA